MAWNLQASAEGKPILQATVLSCSFFALQYIPISQSLRGESASAAQLLTNLKMTRDHCDRVDYSELGVYLVCPISAKTRDQELKHLDPTITPA